LKLFILQLLVAITQFIKFDFKIRMKINEFIANKTHKMNTIIYVRTTCLIKI